MFTNARIQLRRIRIRMHSIRFTRKGFQISIPSKNIAQNAVGENNINTSRLSVNGIGYIYIEKGIVYTARRYYTRPLVEKRIHIIYIHTHMYSGLYYGPRINRLSSAYEWNAARRLKREKKIKRKKKNLYICVCVIIIIYTPGQRSPPYRCI